MIVPPAGAGVERLERRLAAGYSKFLSISFVRQIRLPRKAGEANLPPELLATHLGAKEAPAVDAGLVE
jgi:hypothetical protein